MLLCLSVALLLPCLSQHLLKDCSCIWNELIIGFIAAYLHLITKRGKASIAAIRTPLQMG